MKDCWRWLPQLPGAVIQDFLCQFHHEGPRPQDAELPSRFSLAKSRRVLIVSQILVFGLRLRLSPCRGLLVNETGVDLPPCSLNKERGLRVSPAA